MLVEDGEVIESNLKRQRLTIEEIESEARIEQIGSLEHVRWAILETNGQISFVEKGR